MKLHGPFKILKFLPLKLHLCFSGSRLSLQTIRWRQIPENSKDGSLGHTLSSNVPQTLENDFPQICENLHPSFAQSKKIEGKTGKKDFSGN